MLCCNRVVETLKDYAIKALVNTVDHLGAVSCKVNDLLSEKVNEVSTTELRVSSIQQVLFHFTLGNRNLDKILISNSIINYLMLLCVLQRLRVCQGCFDHEGLAQQSSLINIPKYHKRYILPGNKTLIFL